MLIQQAQQSRRSPVAASGGPRLRAQLFALVAMVAIAVPCSAADTFYLNLLRDGGQSLQDQDFERARFDLRIAGFGLLEEPVLLSQCWILIGLAEAALDNKSGFRDSFDRLTDIERLFAGSYSKANVTAPMRSQYETAAARWITESRLLAVPAFEALAIRSAANRLARLPVQQRRQELETLIHDSPNVSRWHLMLGDIYLGERQHAAARAEADAVLSLQPDNRRARCLRGLALVGENQCSAAVDDLTGCPATRSDRPTAQSILDCQIQVERWAEAKSFYDQLPETVRRHRKISKLGRQIARNAEQPLPTESAADEDPQEGTNAEDEERVAATVAEEAPAQPTVAQRESTQLSAEDQRALARARAMAAEATYKEDFDEVMQIASRLADGNPGHTKAQIFAGEVAYRSRRWKQAIHYLEHDKSALDEDPVLLFYLSVAYFESGQEQRARQLFRRCCSQPGPISIIEEYRRKLAEN